MKCTYSRDVFIRSAGVTISAPCGTCLACRKRKQSQMTFRIEQHTRFSGFKRAFFITLTYAKEFLPYSYVKCDTRTGEVLKDIQSDTPILNPNDIVNFMKRLRRYSGQKFSVFYCGEYGDKFDRPHWHLILHTNLNWRETRDYVYYAWSKGISQLEQTKGCFEVTNKYLRSRKSMGRISVSAVTLRRMRYCAKYVVKDNNSNALVPKYARWSKGYGIDWLKSSEAKLVSKRKELFAYTSDGKPASLSRYYTHRMFTLKEWDDIKTRVMTSGLPPDAIVGNLPSMIKWVSHHELTTRLLEWNMRVNTYTKLRV